MKTVYTILIAIAAATAGAAHAQAPAQDAPGAPHFYAGFAAVHPTGGSGSSPKLFGGVDFNDNLGIEAGYTDFRTHEQHDEFEGTRYDAKEKGYSAYLAGKYTVPLSDRFSAYGKAGLSYGSWDYRSEVNGVSNYRNKSSDTGLYGALGAQYKLTEKVSLNAEYEHLGRTMSNAWSLGVKVGF